MSGTARDSQRQRVYDAEKMVRLTGRKMPTVDEMQEYVDKLTGSAWWLRRYPRLTKITVGSGAGQRRALAFWSLREIRMPVWSRYELIVLHEISHLCNDYLYARGSDIFAPRPAPHGWQFAKAYLELVRHCIGEEAAKELTSAFKEKKVRYRKPPERAPLTPERRAALIARMADLQHAAAAVREERQSKSPRATEVPAGTTCPGCGEAFGPYLHRTMKNPRASVERTRLAYRMPVTGAIVCKPCIPYHKAVATIQSVGQHASSFVIAQEEES